MMNTAATSKDAILDASRALIRQHGWSAVSIRAVAAACGVSVGCIYHYFSSKQELTGAVVESVWHEIFLHPEDSAVFCSTQSCIRWMYRQIEAGAKKYPDFFTLHAIGFSASEREGGRQRMQKMWQHIRQGLTSVLQRDPQLRPDAFNDRFSAEAFADVLFSLLLSAVFRHDYDPSAVLEVIRRTVC